MKAIRILAVLLFASAVTVMLPACSTEGGMSGSGTATSGSSGSSGGGY